MYRYFMQAATELFGHQYAALLLVGMAGLALLTLLIMLNPQWRRQLEEFGNSGSVWRVALSYGFTLLKTGLLLSSLFLITALLHVQAGLLSERQGQVTQRNYEAVRSKWGIPHELRVLSGTLAVLERVTFEEFAGGGSRELVAAEDGLSDSTPGYKLLSDETFTAARDKDNKIIDPLEVVRRQVYLRLRHLETPLVTGSELRFDVQYNPRYLGGAGYAGYEYTANLGYRAHNRQDAPALAEFAFPLPGDGYGVYDGLKVTINGQEQTGITFSEGTLRWQRLIGAGEELETVITYRSRGLDYLRYSPGRFLPYCRVRMNISGFPADKLNFPIGAMSPDTDLKTLSGDKFSLEWNLSNAVTNYSIGVIIPSPRQPGFTAGVILRSAPLGIVLLLICLALSRHLLGGEFCFFSLLLSLFLCYFGYALFAYLGDGGGSFAGAYLPSLPVCALLGGLFWVLHGRGRYIGWQSGVLYVLFAGCYPLAVYFERYTGMILNASYIALTLYVMLLWLLRTRGKDTAAQ